MSPRGHASPVVLLLAAGEGRRFGGIKQLADIAGEAMVKRAARMLLALDLPVLVVTGAYADEVEAALDGLPLSILRCHDWSLGMGHSLAAGTRALTRMYPRASAVMVALADQPLLDGVLLQDMLHRHTLAPEKILATAQHGTLGPPALFPRDCFTALAALSGPHGARGLLQHEAQRVEPFTSAHLIDIDTPADLQCALASLGLALRGADPG